MAILVAKDTKRLEFLWHEKHALQSSSISETKSFCLSFAPQCGPVLAMLFHHMKKRTAMRGKIVFYTRALIRQFWCIDISRIFTNGNFERICLACLPHMFWTHSWNFPRQLFCLAFAPTTRSRFHVTKIPSMMLYQEREIIHVGSNSRDMRCRLLLIYLW